MENTTDAPSARDKLVARVAGHTDEILILTYLTSARAFATNPQGDDSNAHIVLLSILDMELLKRGIECCPECQVPTSTGYHVPQLHDLTPAVEQVVDALANAVTAAAQSSQTTRTKPTKRARRTACHNPNHKHLWHVDATCEQLTTEATR